MNARDFSQHNLEELYQRTPVRSFDDNERFVIFSDLHMGNGSRTDDFVPNGDLFARVLKDYYAASGFHLVLNGDVEELQRFPLREIVQRWPQVYEAFSAAHAAAGLTRIAGNHDIDLLEGGPSLGPLRKDEDREGWPETFIRPTLEALRLRHAAGEIFIFHGHQTSRWYVKCNDIVRIALRYLANPLRIGNYTVSANSRKRFRTERRVYDFATRRRIVSMIGHTHRPLFESMSKVDTIRYEIEHLCRRYDRSDDQASIAKQISALKQELVSVRKRRDPQAHTGSLYKDHVLVPSLFNSGCVLGKRGMTALEIEGGELRLVYWFDTNRAQKFRQYEPMGADATPHRGLGETGYRRMVIKQDTLAYLFSRIQLLA